MSSPNLVQVEYDPSRRRISLNRIFQIPQMFRPTASSTSFVLTSLARYFKPGDIVFFDNFICSTDEFRAFEDLVKAFRVNYEVPRAVQEYLRVCVKIL
jgi:hypothetical protein